ncbi:MAG: TadE/TadG family type IV pilus assembly protein [Frankia sp.]
MALELAIIAPALLAVIALILSYGRYSQVTGLLESAARDGARAATQSRSLPEARQRLDAITADTLRRAAPSCRDSASDQIDSPAFQAGDDVTVTVSCTVSYSDLGIWGAPGSTTVRRSFVSPLDPYRGVG